MNFHYAIITSLTLKAIAFIDNYLICPPKQINTTPKALLRFWSRVFL